MGIQLKHKDKSKKKGKTDKKKKKEQKFFILYEKVFISYLF